jgi:hypothetical protein
MSRLRVVRSTAAASTLALAACSSGVTAIGQGPLPYQYANAFANAGFTESIVGPDRYRIEVRGPLNTPRERMEKIAATRAAEIGKDNRLGYFRIDSVQHDTHCQKYLVGGKPGSQASGEKRNSAYAVMTADVSYAKSPPDASFLEARKTFDQYRAELDQDQSAPPALDPAAVPQCG